MSQDRPYVSKGTGEPTVRVASDLEDADSALGLANIIHARWGEERHWEAPQILVPLSLLPAAQEEALLDLQPGGLLTTVGLDSTPAESAGQEGEWFVEGWVETWDRPGGANAPLTHDAQYAVSDRARFRVDVAPASQMVVTVAPSGPVAYGTTRTVSVTVTNATNGAPVTRGQVALLTASGSPLVPNVTLDAAGKATLVVGGTLLAVGTAALTVKYVGVANVAKPVSQALSLTTTALTPSVVVTGPAQPVGLGASVTLTATVGSGAPGTVVWEWATPGGSTWTAHGSPVAVSGGKATLTWTAAESRDWRARYVPSSTNYLPATSATFAVSATVVPTTTAITASPTTVNNGSNVTLTATVTPTTGGSPAGTITWEYSTDGGSTWKSWFSDTLANGKASRAWTSNTPSANWRWRARYAPSTGWSASLSGSVAVSVLALETKTVTHEANWGASWRADGSKRSDTSDLFQGYYSGTNGNQRSACGFANRASVWNGWTITKVEVYVYAEHWGPNNGGTLILGSHTAANEPGSFPSKTNRETVAWSSKTGGKWINVTDWGKGFATDALDGLTFGPGSSTATEYYGYMAGTGSNRPKVRITGQRWA